MKSSLLVHFMQKYIDSYVFILRAQIILDKMCLELIKYLSYVPLILLIQ